MKYVMLFLKLVLIIFVLLIMRDEYISLRVDNDVILEGKNETFEIEIELIKQEISCGYAVIEMIGSHYGKSITEESLFQDNEQTISTALGKGFLNEMQKQFSEFTTTRYTNLSNNEMIDMIYKSLQKGNVVPFEFSALYQEGDTTDWTLHFALVTGIDLTQKEVTVLNPYGYVEIYTLEDFLKATTYQSYQDMEFVLKLGFYVGLFNRNTVYIFND